MIIHSKPAGICITRSSSNASCTQIRSIYLYEFKCTYIICLFAGTLFNASIASSDARTVMHVYPPRELYTVAKTALLQNII